MSTARSELTLADAREIVARVLGNETALSKGDFDLLAQGLEMASEQEYYAVRRIRIQNAAFQERERLIAQLEAILETYEPQLSYPSLMNYHMSRMGNNFESVMQGLRDMLKIEKFEQAINPLIPVPNARPVSAKNGGAEHMFVVLRKAGIEAWPACTVIAEMLITAGLEDKTQAKVLRALYDKLNRVDLSEWD